MQNSDKGSLFSALRACRFLGGLGEEDLQLVRSTANRVQQPRNTIIFHEGDPCRGFYIVESGAIKIFKESADAKEHVLHVAIAGDCFGEAALFMDTGYPAAAAAIRDSSLVLLAKEPFLDLLARNPEISRKLMASMASWAGRLVRSIETLTLNDAPTRVASYLCSLINPESRPETRVMLDMPKQTLASHLGMTGETLSRLLTRFEDEGLITVRGREIAILSPEKLWDIAGL